MTANAVANASPRLGVHSRHIRCAGHCPLLPSRALCSTHVGFRISDELPESRSSCLATSRSTSLAGANAIPAPQRGFLIKAPGK